MSKLFTTERGYVLTAENEEVTRWRTLEKRIKLPASVARATADLFIFAREYAGSRTPLRVEVNGKPAGQIKPTKHTQCWSWRTLRLGAGRLKAGVNRITLRCDTDAMNAWCIGMEGGHRKPQSYLSEDGGRTWRNHALGVRGTMLGEYVIRVRSHASSLADPRPPRIVYEDATHPRVKAAAKIVPASIRRLKDPWKKTLALRSWITKQWKYRGGANASYTPWDPWTILDWGNRETCHGIRGNVGFCVHYGATLTSLASALGLPARGVIVTGDVNSHAGHFMAEVWSPVHDKWVLHDPTLDVHFVDGDAPQSLCDLVDIRRTGRLLTGMVKKGASFRTVAKPMRESWERNYETFEQLRHVSVWTRNNFTSDPTASPPGHGNVVYCETDTAWYVPDEDAFLPMFTNHAHSRAYFDRAPAAKGQTRKAAPTRRSTAGGRGSAQALAAAGRAG